MANKRPTHFVMIIKYDDNSYSMNAGVYDQEVLKQGKSYHESSKITDKADVIETPELLKIAETLIP